VFERRFCDSWLGMLFTMRARQPQAAVCVVRAELQPPGLLITVTVNRDVIAEHPSTRRHFSDVDDAIGAVAEFLESFSRRSP